MMPIIGDIIASVVGVVGKLIPDKDLAAKIQAEAALSAMQLDYSALEAEVAAKAKVIAAEYEHGNLLSKSWRPLTMLTFTVIIAHNYILSPLFSLPSLEIPESMWELLKLGMGGYIAGRTVEKIVEPVASILKKR